MRKLREEADFFDDHCRYGCERKTIRQKAWIPTANVDAKIHGLRNGVYGVLATVNHQFHLGVMNIGVKPTVGSNLEKTLRFFV